MSSSTAGLEARYRIDGERARAVLFALGMLTEHVLIYGAAACPADGCPTCVRLELER